MAKKKLKAPTWLNADGKAIFTRLSKHVNDSNAESVLMLSQCWQTYVQAVEDLKENGITVVSSTGNVRKNPAYDIGKTSLENFCRLSKLLGLYEEVQEEVESALDAMTRG